MELSTINNGAFDSFLKGIGQKDERIIEKFLQAETFMNSCTLSKIFVKAYTIDNDESIAIYPVIRAKLSGKVNGKKISRTVLGSNNIFASIMTGFGIDIFTSSKIIKKYEEVFGCLPCKEKCECIQKAFKSHIKSEFGKNQVDVEMSRSIEKLKNKVHEDIKKNLKMMASLGENENTVVCMFREAQVDELLKL